jgi:hypothetical protein
MWTLSNPIGTILVLLPIFLFSRPAEAKYSGGSGTAEDPYQIATAADLLLRGDSPEDYDKHFILTADSHRTTSRCLAFLGRLKDSDKRRSRIDRNSS